MLDSGSPSRNENAISVAKQSLDPYQMKKLTQMKYDLLMQKERELMEIEKKKKLRKQDEMKRLHNLINMER